MSLLKVINCWKLFGGLKALQNVNFEANQGILGIIGPNGAGKTTLFNVITGVYKPDKGKVFLKNRDITGLSPHTIRRLGISRTFQIPRPFINETVFENVLAAGFFGRVDKVSKKELIEETEKILEFVGLIDKRDEEASSLNIHQRKLLEIARGLITKPILLLVDEIASGLTPAEVDNVVSLIKKVNEKGIGVIWIEHVMRAIMKAAERIIVLDYGKIISEGSPEKVAKDPLVIRAYLGEEIA